MTYTKVSKREEDRESRRGCVRHTLEISVNESSGVDELQAPEDIQGHLDAEGNGNIKFLV